MRLRPKPNATPDDLAFGVNPVAMAIERGLARSLLFLSDTTNRRVLGLIETAIRIIPSRQLLRFDQPCLYALDRVLPLEDRLRERNRATHR